MEGEHKVSLYVYELSQGMARQFSAPLLGKQIDGIWHTAVVVFGKEYFFGGGIQYARPGTTPFGRPVEVVELGSTYIPENVFEEYLVELSGKYNMSTYNLLSNNCNSFSEDVAQFLTGNSIPAHITGLPAEVLSTPLGSMLAPMITQMENQMRGYGMGTMVNPEAVPSAASGMSVSSSPGDHPASSAPSAPTTSLSAPWAPSPSSSEPVYSGPISMYTDPPSSAPVRGYTQAASPTPTQTPPASSNELQSVAPSQRPPSASSQQDFKAQVQAEFALIIAEGLLSANEAAVEAMKRVRCRIGSKSS